MNERRVVAVGASPGEERGRREVDPLSYSKRGEGELRPAGLAPHRKMMDEG